MFSLKGKSAVITGAGSGIGKAVALLFAEQGATVHVMDLHDEGAGVTVSEILNKGGLARLQVCSVASQQAVRDALASIGNIDILVRSAGISHIGNVENTSDADF